MDIGLSGNVSAADQVRSERIAEERAQKTTKFHDIETGYVEKRNAGTPYVKETTHEIDLSQKPFSNIVQHAAKKAVQLEEARKKRRAQMLVAERHKEALIKHEAKTYAKEAVEEKELLQK